MNKALNVLTIIVALIFVINTSPLIAASSDKKESTKKSATSKSTKSKDSKSKSTKKKSTAKKSTKKKSPAKKATAPFKGTVNINKATKEELMQLPGIGEVKATEIIKTRKKFGKFKTADDLLEVNGIGDQTLKGIKKHLKF